MLRPLAFVALCLSSVAFGMLPLPYPLDPIDEDLESPRDNSRAPKSVAAFFELYKGSQLREMELPNFGDQQGALGYTANKTFQVPPTLRKRVNFWVKVFAEYTKDQAILHDSSYPEIVYDVVDVSRFTKNESLSWRARRRMLDKFLKGRKKTIEDKLLQLHALRNSPLKIPLELFSLFKLFKDVEGDNKFLLATQRIRTQSGLRDQTVRGFFFGGRYFPKMMEIFEQKKIPKEITRLTLVESGFNLAARSKVGASGVWQFMPATGKRYLRIDRFVDERNDPITATWAAAELLQKNYEVLGAWPLAITAYNHGREGVARAMRVLATNDLSDIIERYKSRTFGFASSNFYPSFLAVLEVEREYRKHFGKLMVDAPIQYEEFLLTANVAFEEMADVCGMEKEELELFNPALTDFTVSGKGYIPEGYRLKVPTGKASKCRSGFVNVTPVREDRELSSRNDL